MAEPFTWQTVQTIAAALAVIDGTAPFYTDAGKRIDTEIRALADTDVYPRIVVIETDFAPTSRNKAATITAANAMARSPCSSVSHSAREATRPATTSAPVWP